MFLHQLTVTVVFELHFQIRLFFGNRSKPISVVSIRISKTSQNFEHVISAICALDQCISGDFGGLMIDSKNTQRYTSDKYASTLKRLFNDLNQFDPYISSTFLCFVKNKRKMDIHMRFLDKIKSGKMMELIFYGLKKTNSKEIKDDNNNILTAQLLNTFKYIDTILINTDSDTFALSGFYTFSLFRFLSSIEHSHVQKIVIKGSKPREFGSKSKSDNDDTWLNVLWASCSQDLIHKYNEKNFRIEFKSLYRHDEIIISKK